MDSILTSIQPKWCELIASGRKTWEVRKTAPKCDTPFKCYIYCTAIKDKKRYSDEFDIPIETGKWKGNSHVVGEFVCDMVYEIKNRGNAFMVDNNIALTNGIARASCLDFVDLSAYLGDKNGCAWHISDLVIYDTPKSLSEFARPLDRANCGYKDCGAYDCGRCTMAERVCEKRIITRPPQSWCFAEVLRI